MDDNHIMSVAQLTALVKHGQCVKFKSKDKGETYKWIDKTLGRFKYFRESKKNRGIIKMYIIIMTGLGEGRVDKLIRRKKRKGKVFLMERTQHTFPRKYEIEDIFLLTEVSTATDAPNGNSLKRIFHDSYHLYNDLRFERLKQISVSHIYNLQKSKIYQSGFLNYTKTKPVKSSIGERRKPRPEGKPGFLRVDSVHQGDLDKVKGVYHITLVDEVTQWAIVGCVEGISEFFLEPLLERLLQEFPFLIFNFHSDNGSEYINKTVASLLNRLNINQTKSRARQSGDNGLVEGKNNVLVRKPMGYKHIPKKYAKDIDQYYTKYYNPHINFHRHSAYATDYTDSRGKIKKKYETYMTPVQKLLSIPNVSEYLKDGITIESLMEEQMKMSHLESAKNLQEQKAKLYKNI